MSSIVTVTVFRYQPYARFQAFANMGRFLLQPMQVPDLQFSKLMGSGRNFGLVPDFSTYVHLGVWQNETSASTFSATPVYQQLQKGSEQISTLYLKPQRSHGLWDGQNPFDGEPEPAHSITTHPVAVLTRATIRPRALPDFWRHVPKARQRLTEQGDSLLFGIGVGEVPLAQQCTISVWRDPAAVDQYAYRQTGHKEVVRLTRQRRWYTEELFARFRVCKAEGDLFGKVARLLTSVTESQ
ncbi:DUF3291 domain-containing protein [Spirosoma fluminis]